MLLGTYKAKVWDYLFGRHVIVAIFIHSFVNGALVTTGKKKPFLQDFLEILKPLLQNFRKIVKKCFPVTTCIVIYLAGLNS